MAMMSKVIHSFPWEDKYAYGMYLAQTYYYVKHSTRLLAVAAGRMADHDLAYHRRFLEHAAEEKGHETIALKDLKNLGYTLEDFPELPETRMFWETQYYKVEHVDPLSLMGYILALEAIACQECPWIKSQLDKHYRPNCHTFIKVHGEDDPEHVTKARAQIEALSPERIRHVEGNFDQTAICFQSILEAICDKVQERKLLVA